MKIRSIEVLQADAGSRPYSFVKVTTESGLVGWSEFTAAVGNTGIVGAIERYAGFLVGQPADRIEWAMAIAYTRSMPVWNGIAAHARAAIGNALLDVTAKAAGVPVHAMFGGKVRDRVAVYWTHFGSARINTYKHTGLERIRDYADLTALAAEAEARGYPAVKMNMFVPDGDGLRVQSPGHGQGPGFPALNSDPAMFDAIDRQFEAIRKGSDKIGLMIDLNFNFKREGFRQVMRRLEKWDMYWAEFDCYDPEATALVHRGTSVPVAGGESLIGRRGYRPYFEAYAHDVSIVDVIWNGFLESYKIAAMAEAYELNIAPHNFYGCLADHISGCLAAVVPNFRIMEYEVEDVPWREEFYSHPTVVENGEMVIPDRPGWGVDVIEAAVRARPWTGGK